MINYKTVKKFCCEDISKIENYEQAALDTTETWHCHHKLGISTPKKILKEMGLYFDRPASELQFLKKADHRSLHNEGKKNLMRKEKMSEEKRLEVNQKISDTMKDRIASGEIVADAHQMHTEEAAKKISEKAKERYKDPHNHPMFGRKMSEETKRKISEAKRRKHLERLAKSGQ